MNFLEWILNLVSSIASLWNRSSYNFINEHRAYERRILIYTVIAVILMLAAMLITPSLEMQSTDGIKHATYIVYKCIGIGALLLGLCFSIASFWNAAGLIYFRYKNGISN
ncbi:hypothetical protein C3Y98_04335 [Methylotenera oryzisoli]|uniref:Uncharacterized protein n=1 Tax=Methylotenera oryzisoli TaxID=2080758 RepID=A0A4Y9VU76_9PROT|nr:hypothetical protein [Methylotenera oryzisoli]TFW72339.1 hypothetical protein C3Y98_04335 [Methylotenera oryzisoli]